MKLIFTKSLVFDGCGGFWLGGTLDHWVGRIG